MGNPQSITFWCWIIIVHISDEPLIEEYSETAKHILTNLKNCHHLGDDIT